MRHASQPVEFASLAARQSVRLQQRVLRKKNPALEFSALISQPAVSRVYARMLTLSSRRNACRTAREKAVERAYAVRKGHHHLFGEASKRQRERARRDRGGACWQQLKGALAEKDPVDHEPVDGWNYARTLRERYGSFGFRAKRILHLHGRPTVTFHLARDIMMPPGSPIFSPVDAEVIGVEVRATYSLIELVDVHGRYWRFLHLDSDHLGVKAGEALFEGQLVGYTSFHRLPKSSSHLHLELWESREEREAAMARLRATGARRVAAYGRSLRAEPAALDPLEHLGPDGLNTLLGMDGPVPEDVHREVASFSEKPSSSSACSGARLLAIRAQEDVAEPEKICALAKAPRPQPGG